MVFDEAFRAGRESRLQLREVDVFLRELHARPVALVQRQRIDVVAVRQAEEQIEALRRRRPERRDVPEMPLADERSRIFGLQRLGDRHLGLRQSASVIRENDLIAKPGANRITARQQSGARRRAEVRGGIKVGEQRALPHHPVEVRGAHALAPHRGDVAVTEVVAQNDDEVRPPPCRAPLAREPHGRATAEAALDCRKVLRSMTFSPASNQNETPIVAPK